ncbi:hypothetical protein COO60DRAFT_910410 [Scenedesmus sp. NREL 46B-D3]|nr:hypothetical protein COO60DRAFT_910410 [Scenedesmus sp. NREL 46B-D3]
MIGARRHCSLGGDGTGAVAPLGRCNRTMHTCCKQQPLGAVAVLPSTPISVCLCRCAFAFSFACVGAGVAGSQSTSCSSCTVAPRRSSELIGSTPKQHAARPTVPAFAPQQQQKTSTCMRCSCSLRHPRRVQQRQQQRRATGGSRTGPRALPNLRSFCGCGSSRDGHGVRTQVHVQQCSISVQALYFCPPGRPTRSCTAGWTLADALGQLEERGQSIPTAACLPYRPDYRRELTVGELCSGGCSSPNQHASKGRFTSMQINSMWEAQRHIRQYGAVVARFEVMSDFMAFFAEKRNAQAV